ncbi:MAG: 16S rRNA (adenine(1518)-N(6)/adenine(1519)-N(6))-dimethyltransferase RsmA [Clostridiales bacterium]|nr:16S rRNA (adenine(1518)-N(6)/adenine(1519)-N(6))-dimethyltransferase RsmA [Clostridiales bacterium]
MELLKETKLLMKKYNITANKRLGQNFLIDEEPIIKAIEAANITKEDLVIEIGPGLGTLTKYLLEEAGKVICIELDERMLKILNDRFLAYSNFQLINDDVLKVDLKNLIKSEKTNEIKNVKIVANLPYYITTPIIMKLLEERLDIKSITVMVQKEVADRLVAKPGEEFSGAITYSINYYTNPEKVIDAPNTSFLPAPEVDSAIIKLDVLEQPAVKVLNEKTLFKVIKLAFMQKRKTLLNAFSNGNLLKSKNEIEKMLECLNIDLKIRGEKLTLEQFAEIADYIERIKQK